MTAYPSTPAPVGPMDGMESAAESRPGREQARLASTDHGDGKDVDASRPARKKRRPKDLGTDAERAVVRYLQANGWPHAERRATRGRQDAGDVTGTPGLCWEVKTRNKPPSDAQIAAWLAETETERINAAEDVGVLVVRRPYAAPGAWWAVMSIATVSLLRVAIKPPPNRMVVADAPARLLLADAVTLLRSAGYGDALPKAVTAP